MVTVPSNCQDVNRVQLKTAQQHSAQVQRLWKPSREDPAVPLLVPSLALAKISAPHHTQSCSAEALHTMQDPKMKIYSK